MAMIVAICAYQLKKKHGIGPKNSPEKTYTISEKINLILLVKYSINLRPISRSDRHPYYMNVEFRLTG